ncbi:cupredoxin domain-containing protein [Tistrella bauzanensis]
MTAITPRRASSAVGTITLALTAVLTATIIASAAPARADGGHGFAFGRPATATEATRSVTITMRDVLFEPDSLTVAPGEVIRFVLKNEGALLHEFNLGTPDMHARHQREMAMMMEHGMLTATGMREMPAMDHARISGMDMSGKTMSGMDMSDMKHDDPNSVLVAPGGTAELVWQFAKADALEFACNVPGHYESGMIGPIGFGQ